MAHVIAATCARCGKPCERGPWREPLCNGCALKLGQQEVQERLARRDRVQTQPRGGTE